MANQTRQLAELLEREGAKVTLVQTNAPYRPRFIASIRGVRGLFRLVPYVLRLWRVTGQVDVVHVMANSGWSWHLCAAPAIWIAHWRRVPAVVNYRGGEADTFLARSGATVRRTLQRSAALIVPSGFLKEVFERHRIGGRDRSQHHRPRAFPSCTGRRPTHDTPSGRRTQPGAHLRHSHRVARFRGDPPIRVGCPIDGGGLRPRARHTGTAFATSLASRTTCTSAVRATATKWPPSTARRVVVLNPSQVDNMPNSVLEAMASGVPVVSTERRRRAFHPARRRHGVPGAGRATRKRWPTPRSASSAIQTLRAASPRPRHSTCNSTRGRMCGNAGPTSIGTQSPATAVRPAGHVSRQRTPASTRVSCRGAIFPLHERLKGHSTVAVRQALEASQWWPPERLAAAQFARLEALLRNANDSVPYYRDLFRRSGFDPRAMTALADLERLPLLTKADIRANTESLKATTATGLTRSNTGGSSGEPLVFFLGKERVSHDVAAKWRATRWWGVDIGDREIVVWGSPIELDAQDRRAQSCATSCCAPDCCPRSKCPMPSSMLSSLPFATCVRACCSDTRRRWRASPVTPRRAASA